MKIIVQINAPIRQVVSHHPQPRFLFHRENANTFHRVNREMIDVHKNFRSRINNLSIMQMCQVCNEFYLGIQFVR